MATQVAPSLTAISEYDAVVETMKLYEEGGRAGRSDLMRGAFHPDATIFGYTPGGGLLTSPIRQLFDWIDANDPSPELQLRLVSIQVLESIAYVQLEAENWSGKLAGSGVRMSDVFTLLHTGNGWKIIHKAFYWHGARRSE